jgi:hypothetical protein
MPTIGNRQLPSVAPLSEISASVQDTKTQNRKDQLAVASVLYLRDNPAVLQPDAAALPEEII